MLDAKQIRAARALLDWSQDSLAHSSGVARASIKNIENGLTTPRPETMSIIRETLEKAGVEFTLDSGVRMKNDVLTVIEGKDVYLRLLDNIYHTLKGTKEEALFYCVDDRLSSQEVVEAVIRMRKDGIGTRFLNEDGNDFIHFPLKDYRGIPKEFFNNNVQIIYSDRVATLINGGQKIFTIKNESFADTQRNIFNFLWNHCKMPLASNAQNVYE